MEFSFSVTFLQSSHYNGREVITKKACRTSSCVMGENSCYDKSPVLRRSLCAKQSCMVEGIRKGNIKCIIHNNRELQSMFAGICGVIWHFLPYFWH